MRMYVHQQRRNNASNIEGHTTMTNISFSTRANAVRSASRHAFDANAIIINVNDDNRYEIHSACDDIVYVEDVNRAFRDHVDVDVATGALVTTTRAKRVKRKFSTIENPCAIVREYAAKNVDATRQDALKHLVPMGVDPITVSVQFYKARKRQQAMRVLNAIAN